MRNRSSVVAGGRYVNNWNQQSYEKILSLLLLLDELNIEPENFYYTTKLSTTKSTNKHFRFTLCMYLNKQKNAFRFVLHKYYIQNYKYLLARTKVIETLRR